MNIEVKKRVRPSFAIILYQISGFGFIWLFLWVDELFDIPHYLFGSMETPVNIAESIFESIIILFIGIFCVGVTMRLMTKIKVLEGLVPICSSCKKIRDQNHRWQHIETYIESRSDASFTHGICEDCMEQLYGDQDWYKKHKSKRL